MRGNVSDKKEDISSKISRNADVINRVDNDSINSRFDSKVEHVNDFISPLVHDDVKNHIEHNLKQNYNSSNSVHTSTNVAKSTNSSATKDVTAEKIDETTSKIRIKEIQNFVKAENKNTKPESIKINSENTFKPAEGYIDYSIDHDNYDNFQLRQSEKINTSLSASTYDSELNHFDEYSKKAEIMYHIKDFQREKNSTKLRSETGVGLGRRSSLKSSISSKIERNDVIKNKKAQLIHRMVSKKLKIKGKVKTAKTIELQGVSIKSLRKRLDKFLLKFTKSKKTKNIGGFVNKAFNSSLDITKTAIGSAASLLDKTTSSIDGDKNDTNLNVRSLRTAVSSSPISTASVNDVVSISKTIKTSINRDIATRNIRGISTRTNKPSLSHFNGFTAGKKSISMAKKIRKKAKHAKKVKKNAQKATKSLATLIKTTIENAKRAVETIANVAIPFPIKLIIDIIIALIGLILIVALLINITTAPVGAMGSIVKDVNWVLPAGSSKVEDIANLLDTYEGYARNAKDILVESLITRADTHLTEDDDYYAAISDGWIEYQGGAGADTVRQIIDSYFDSIDLTDMYANLFVHLQNKMNIADGNGADDIYDINFTQNDFNDFLPIYMFNNVIFKSNLTCPGANCHTKYCTDLSGCGNKGTGQGTTTNPETGEEITYTYEYCKGHPYCDNLHKKSVIEFYVNPHLHSQLGFDDTDKELVQVTLTLFQALLVELPVEEEEVDNT